MNHTEWQNDVVDLAQKLGWSHLHVRRTRGKGGGWTTSTNVEGWPDLLLWNEHRPGIVAIELKVKPDAPRQNQLDVLASLERGMGALVAVAYPEQLDDVVAMLDRRRQPFPPYTGKVAPPLRRR